MCAGRSGRRKKKYPNGDAQRHPAEELGDDLLTLWSAECCFTLMKGRLSVLMLRYLTGFSFADG